MQTRRQALQSLISLAGAGLTAVATAGSATPPVKDWLLRSDQPSRKVPLDYLGIHSNHGLGIAANLAPAYPYDAIRSHDVADARDRSTLQWGDIERQPGVYDWYWVDKWIAAHPDRTRTWVLCGTPQFYQKYPHEPFAYANLHGRGSPPKDPKVAAAFISALLQRHPGKINFVELWNEPNLGPGTDAARDRFTPEFARTEGEGGWFTGTADDLAALACAVRKRLPDGVKLMACAWVNQDRDDPSNAITRFADAADGDGGCGRDHIQALSVHAYTSNFKPGETVDVLRRYEQRFRQAGFREDLGRYVTEIGAEGEGHWTEERPPTPEKVTSILRWGMIPAAFGYQGIYYYHHSTMRQLGDPSHHPELSNAIATVRNALRGKTITEAAVLEDDTISLRFSDGTSLRA